MQEENLKYDKRRKTKSRVRIASLILHGVYSILNILYGLPFLGNQYSILIWEWFVGGRAIINFWYWSVMSLGILALVGLVLNLCGMPRKKIGENHTLLWIIWTLLAPVIMVASCFFSSWALIGVGGAFSWMA